MAPRSWHAIDASVLDEIKAASAKHSIEARLIAAIVVQETGGNSFLCRFEPRAYRDHLAKTFAAMCGTSLSTEICQQRTSWGLMQVMGFVARELGFSSPMPKLCLADVGLKYGCLKLLELRSRFAPVSPSLMTWQPDLVAAYNAGSPRRREDGAYVNQRYVDGVQKFYLKFSEI